MNKRAAVILLLALVAVLVLEGVVTPGQAAQADKDGSGVYAIWMEVAAGGSYHLDAGTWQVQGTADGPGYHLESLAVPAGTGTPCCCAHLPCILRKQ
jgi:sugar lactone lactonase YvrE